MGEAVCSIILLVGPIAPRSLSSLRPVRFEKPDRSILSHQSLINHRHHNQHKHGQADAKYDGDGQRPSQLGSVAKADGHGNKGEDRGNGCHEKSG